ncbi:MAG: glycerophosphodiester phosphodiesterase [Thermoproteota archaeon]|nr:MAG: glycerophosphodiester phosphodiesterase [Candidatus Korarchaeota archaeon]
MPVLFLAVAHRGASAYEPENTLRAIRRALELGANAVEVDVRVTKDRRLAVIHDETLDRTTSGSGKVREYTLAELKELDAGMGERIPSLEEALEEARGCLLVVELKDPDAVGELASSLSGRRGVIAVSFHHNAIRELSRLLDIELGVIFSCRPVHPAKLAQDAGATLLLPKHTYVDRELVREAHREGLRVVAWTVDSPTRMRELMEMGVDGIASNKPDLLVREARALGLL